MKVIISAGLTLLLEILPFSTLAQTFEEFPEPSSQDQIFYNDVMTQAQKAEAEEPQGDEIDPLLMLYYRKFKIETTVSGRIMCDFELVLHNATPYKVNTLNIQLIWPKMRTTSSFYDVMPYQAAYFPMTLLGEGCYSMDKVPNIVVNTCRVKGLKGAACAQTVKWVKVK